MDKKDTCNGTTTLLRTLKLSIHQKKHLKKGKSQFPQNNIEQHNCLTLTIRKVSNHHIRVISGASCDIDDWSNNAENSALHLRNNDI